MGGGGGGEGVGLDAVQQALYLCFHQPTPSDQWQNVRKVLARAFLNHVYFPGAIAVEPKRKKMKNKPNQYKFTKLFKLRAQEVEPVIY